MRKSNDFICIEAKFNIHVTDVISVVGTIGHVEELLDYCPNDFLSGRISFVDLLHSDDQDIAEELFSTQITDTPHTVNLRLRRKNGRIRCIKATYQKHTNDDSDGLFLELLLQDARTLKRTIDEATNMVNFQAMMENTDDYIYFKDRNHVFTGASQTLVALCDPAEHWTDLLGQTDYDVFPEEYADIYYRLEKQVFAGIPIAHEIQEYLSKEGEKGWVDNRKYPIHDKEGNIIGLYGIARDITDRIQAEEALRQANKVVERSPVVLFRWKAVEGWPVELVSSNVKQFGYTANELLSGDVPYSSIVHPDDLEQVTSEVKQYSLSGVDDFTQEYRLVSPAGEVFWIDDRTTVERDADGNITHYQGVILDITERKKNDYRFRAIIDASPVPFALNDDDNNIIYLNSAFSNTFGYTLEDMSDLDEWWPKAYPDDEYRSWVAVSWQEHLEKARITGGPFEPMELRIRSKSGEYKEVIAHASSLTEDFQGVHLVVLYDISERKQAEEERQRLQRELQRAMKVEAVYQVTGGVAHHFNNLLSIILGFSELASDSCKTTGHSLAVGYLDDVNKAGEEAAGLIAKMLAFSQGTQGNLETASLLPLIEDSIEVLDSTLPSTIEIRVNFKDSLPHIKFDPVQLKHVLKILVNNACDAMEGEGTLSINLYLAKEINEECSTCHKKLDGNWLGLSVSDTGAGIKPENIEKIFTPFFSTKEVGEGNGLGLEIALGIMHRHNGHMLVESEVGKGSTFRLLFPV